MFELSGRLAGAFASMRLPLRLSCQVFGSALLTLAFAHSAGHAHAQTPTAVTVPTWRYDLTHSGQNTSETALTPDNVTSATFGKLFSIPVDGLVYAQPLYVAGLTMSDGLPHNVLFVATEHDSVYAFDADSNGGTNGPPLWQISLLSTKNGAQSGATTIPWGDTASPDISPEIGITGTPAIDTATNTLYVVAASKEKGSYYSRLHAINIFTGAEQSGSPVAITATVQGSGTGSSGGKLAFSPLWQNQRTALNVYNGSVYFGYGAHGDNGPWHGWLFAYDESTLAQTAVICTSPNGFGAGVWQAGSGMPIDQDADGGRMFLVTGNGTLPEVYPPVAGVTDLGESIINFSLANGGLVSTDAFTSFNGAKLNSADLDQGSGGILMAPDQESSTPHVLVESGKEGRILIVNRDALGGMVKSSTVNTNVLQDIPGEIGGLWSTPAYWNGNVYVWGRNDTPKMFQMLDGVLSTTPTSTYNVQSLFPGASFTVSSNGTDDGIAWAVRSDQYHTKGPAVLYAWDATNLSNLLYESDSNPSRDSAGVANKLAIPLVTNGKVYVPAQKQITVYGLFASVQVADAPTISPNGGSVTAGTTVQLATDTPNAAIYYTTDGSTPTISSSLYTGPITIAANTTVKAISSALGYLQSPLSNAAFTLNTQTPPVNILPAAGNYTTAQTVTLSDLDPNAKIYYTTNGSTPTKSSKLYSGPFIISSNMTVKALASDSKLKSSAVGSAAYTFQLSGTTISYPNGFSSVAGLTLNGNATNADDSRLQITSGAFNQRSSVFASTPVGVTSFTTDFAFQLSQAVSEGFTFTIQNKGATALGSDNGGLGYAGIKKSVAIKFDFFNNAGEGKDSTGVYTNGVWPTVPSVDMTKSGMLLNKGNAIQAHITYDGTTLTMTLQDMVTLKSFTLTKAINIPSVVGANTAYVGFTGSTGASMTASQKLLYWTYTGQ